MSHPLINILMLPFRLPGLIAEKVAPKIDVLAPPESLDRRSFWSSLGGTVAGSAGVLSFIGAGLLGVGLAGGFVTTAAVAPALCLAGAGYVAAIGAGVCHKIHLDCTVHKLMNDFVEQVRQTAPSAEPAIKQAPGFNHVAATVLDKDIQAMPAIRLAARRGVSP